MEANCMSKAIKFRNNTYKANFFYNWINLSVGFILFIPNNIQAKAGQKLPLKTGQKMNFPPVDKRLYYIYCNQLFRDIFRQAPTCPFFALFPKRRVNPTEELEKPDIYSSVC